MRSEVWRLDPPLILAERENREREKLRERKRGRVNEEGREREREEISWECYFDVCVVYYKVVILQILQPLGLVS